MRPLLVAGFVLALLVAGALLNAQRDQQDAQQRALAEQQHNAAVMTATTVASGTMFANIEATQRADLATQRVPIDAQATQSLATLEASRTALAATVTAGQVSAGATNTALARP